MNSKQVLYRSCFLLFVSIYFFACTAQENSPTGTGVPGAYADQNDTSTGGTQANSPEITNIPTPCTGWDCTLEGTVYGESIEAGNELAGIPVNFKQISWCSPTAGEQVTKTDSEGKFLFDVYLHDTDSFLISIDTESYSPVKEKLGGFDCLYCHCPPLEIIVTKK